MSSFTLKILGIIFMTIDHIGFLLFPQIRVLRIIGRLAFPIFAFQIGVGFRHTKSKEKYILRMLIFTIISQIPFTMAIQAAAPGYGPILNIGATLTCGLLALYSIEKIDKIWLKLFSLFIVALIGIYIPMDYGLAGILSIVILYYFKDSKVIISSLYITLVLLNCAIDNSLFNVAEILALIPIYLHNGKKGPDIKYLFYLFYPLHQIVLVFLKYLLI